MNGSHQHLKSDRRIGYPLSLPLTLNSAELSDAAANTAAYNSPKNQFKGDIITVPNKSP